MLFCFGFSHGFAVGLPKPVVEPLTYAVPRPRVLLAAAALDDASNAAIPVAAPFRAGSSSRSLMPFLGPGYGHPRGGGIKRGRHCHPPYVENATDVAIPVVAPVRAGFSRMTSGRIRSMAVFMFYREFMQPRIVFGRRRAWPLTLLDGFFALPPELQVARTSEAKLLC
ncbi:hypothetical protein VPH35_128890 [Triticum aestivum]